MTVSEVAARLGIPAHLVRSLDVEGALRPVDRAPGNAGRLYDQATLDAIPGDTIATWRHRCATPDDGLLSTGEAAAILDIHPDALRNLTRRGLLTAAAATDGGHRRYRRADLDALPTDAIAALNLTRIGPAAASAGLSPTTLRQLVNDAKVTSSIDAQGTRRFDLATLHHELSALGLLGAPDNPILSIGELADHPEVHLHQRKLRALSDQGVLPVAARLGGKRRYRQNDALEALRNARAAGSLDLQPAHHHAG